MEIFSGRDISSFIPLLNCCIYEVKNNREREISWRTITQFVQKRAEKALILYLRASWYKYPLTDSFNSFMPVETKEIVIKMYQSWPLFYFQTILHEKL